MNQCLCRDGLVRTILRAMREPTSPVIMVTGESGVGKSTVIDAALHQLEEPAQIAKHALTYSAGSGASGELKSYFNNILVNFGSSVGIPPPVYQQGHSSSATALSSSTYRVPAQRLSLVQEPSNVTFETSEYRLNGSDHLKFFDRLWSYLENNRVRGFHLANLEMAQESDIELIGILAQTVRPTSKLILEIGTLRNPSAEHVISRMLQKVHRREVIHIRIEPFSFEAAQEFHRQVEHEERRRLPPFRHHHSHGNPFAIRHGLKRANDDYGFSEFVSQSIRNDAEKFSLIMLALFYGLIDSHDYFIRLSRLTGFSFDIAHLQQQGIVNGEDGRVSLSHALFRVCVGSEMRQDLADMINLLTPKIEKKYPWVAVYLRLHHHDLFDAYDHRLGQKFIHQVVSALDRYDLQTLGLLLSVEKSIIKQLTEEEKQILLLVDAQYHLYHGKLRSGRYEIQGRDESQVRFIWEILLLQQLYHDNRFADAIAAAEALQRRLMSSRAPEPRAQKMCERLVCALRGASEVGAGCYEAARENLVAARTLHQPSRRDTLSDYLRLLDSFIYGHSYLAKLEPHAAADIENRYVRAKYCHNILMSKLHVGKINEDYAEDLHALVINSLHEMNSREVSYPMNNLGVYYLVREQWERAEEVLLETLDVTFEVYDRLACLVNLTVAAGLQRKWKEALEYGHSSILLIDERGFSDPSFQTKAFVNTAIAACGQGEWELAGALLARISYPDDYRYRDRASRKIGLVRSFIDSGTVELEKVDTSVYADSYVFWPQLLCYWDFTIPVIDSGLLTEIFPGFAKDLESVENAL